jgi:hypothetical protein
LAPEGVGARKVDRKFLASSVDTSTALVAAIDDCPQHAVSEQALIFGLVNQVRGSWTMFEPTIDGGR